MREIKTANAPAAIGPYSQATENACLVFVSGQLPVDPATGEIELHDVRRATALVFHNISAVLAAAGLTLADIVKTTVFMADLGQFAAMNEVYAAQFTAPYPARATIGVAALPKGAPVEIEAIAMIPKANTEA